MKLQATEKYVLITSTYLAFERSEAIKTRLESLNLDELDWESMVLAAIQHRVDGLLINLIDILGLSSKLSELTKERVNKRLESSKKRYSIMHKEIQDIIAATKEAGIKTLVLRGPVLSRLYSEGYFRHFKDFDLVIDHQEKRQLDICLANLGYVQGNLNSSRDAIVPPSKKDREAEKYQKHLHAYLKFFPDKNDIFIIEPHTQLISQYYPYSLPSDFIFDIGKEGNALAEKVALPTPNPEKFAIELCLHFYQHAVELPAIRSNNDLLLYRLVDMYVLFRHVPMNWELMFSIVRKHHLEVPITYTLYLFSEIYDFPIPNLEVLLPENIKQAMREVWYFTSGGRFEVVSILEDEPVTRMFDRSSYSNLDKLENLDETRVRNSHLKAL